MQLRVLYACAFLFSCACAAISSAFGVFSSSVANCVSLFNVQQTFIINVSHNVFIICAILIVMESLEMMASEEEFIALKKSFLQSQHRWKYVLDVCVGCGVGLAGSAIFAMHYRQVNTFYSSEIGLPLMITALSCVARAYCGHSISKLSQEINRK